MDHTFKNREFGPNLIIPRTAICEQCGETQGSHVLDVGLLWCPAKEASEKAITSATPAATSAKDAAPRPSALDVQVGGDHYKDKAIQPVEYIHANGIGFFEGNVIKYCTRWRGKGGLADLRKARHYIDLLIELEEKQNATENSR